MAELINPNSEERQEAASPSVEGAGSAGAAGFSKFLQKTRAYVVAAMPAILASCGGVIEDGKQTGVPAVEQNGPSNSTENVDWQKRHVAVNYDNVDWHFQGTYMKDFRAVVYVDGKEVSNKVVTIKDGKFEVAGLAGENIGTIDVQAFEADAPFEKAAEIPIEPDPKSAGMVGNPHFQSGPMQGK